ncbi:MAG TPA: S8 family serine peptidase, partial [Verrucomicrobiae bacterium]|nr:S8 family serine peptidase [Verrucomicrobiae bacterium]
GEGTAMLEIVRNLAPGAGLFFATAGNSEASFAQNILDLRSAGCDIIVDDFGYYDESPFQDGPVAQAVNSVTASGALYFSAAGNDGNQDDGTSCTWEGDFVDGGEVGSVITNSSTGFPGETGARVHSFGAANYATANLSAGFAEVVLFWSDPLGAAADDYDLFVLSSTGDSIDDFSNNTQNGTQDPFESCSSSMSGERIVIVKVSGAARFLHVSALSDGNSTLSPSTPGNMNGHQCASNAFCVAASDATVAFPNLFTTANVVESFSSDGPRHMFFNQDGTAITPRNFTSTGGYNREKPDLTAADGITSDVPGFTPFYGTSAAAPHAAAVAALVKSYQPGLTPHQIRSILTGACLDIMTPGFDRDSGAGIVMAVPALQSATPVVLSASASGGMITLSWNTAAGHSYQPQYSDNLGSIVWNNLGAAISGNNTTVTASDNAGVHAQRFYRILVH